MMQGVERETEPRKGSETGVEAFGAHRPLLVGLAYRMLGSLASAEDVVQEAYLRWRAAPREEVETPRAYLATMVTRLCLDELKSARARREAYVGPWLPEPVRTEEPVDRQSLSFAFLLLLERLSPVERAVYLLHEVFDYSHAEVAEILGKEEASCRQILHRAERHLAAGRPRFAPSPDEHQRLLTSFLQAMSAGDLAGLRSLLAADATAWSDGGGRAKAARKPVRGGDAVARLFLGLGRKAVGMTGLEVGLAEVNGWPALVVLQDGRPFMTLGIETDGERIHNVYLVLNPDKLRLAPLVQMGAASGA